MFYILFYYFFFFVSVTTFWSSKSTSILKNESCFYRKVNLVGTLGDQNVRKNPKKVSEKQDFLRKTSFRPNRFFYMVVNQKLIIVNSVDLDDQKHLKF
ncbi:Uncharacterized protein FWK35_00036038 [Aphis craccivora]|uniref:Uncharacterized protein n=1 Tax=Aphis craccivora TaxID=307492 RepID=A0A6G0Y160_APHCR|nr:Uncharacterized protein FWK35_00036038 [Aphis craccivora]